MLISINDQHILTDPIFIGRASPFSFMEPKRAGKTPLAIADLPAINVVVISHNHYDHLSIPSLKVLNNLQPDIQYFVPLGLADLLKRQALCRLRSWIGSRAPVIMA